MGESGWKWPHEWLVKYPWLSNIVVQSLKIAPIGLLGLIMMVMKESSQPILFERISEEEKAVLFVGRNLFGILIWYPNRVFECSLCKKEADSHDHLFFKCEYALKFWRKMCDIASMKIKEDTWEEIVSVMVGPERFRVMPLMDVILPYCDVAAAVRVHGLHEGNVTLNASLGCLVF
ncbi:hypothetical protein Tco_1567063 [Tanacetum coccineum]